MYKKVIDYWNRITRHQKMIMFIRFIL